MGLKTVSEKSRLPIVVDFLDYAWVAVTPETLRYRLDCLTTDSTILDWTSITPDQTVSIAVTPTQNSIINTRNLTERKSLVVEAEHGTDNAYTANYDWFVKNLRGVT